MMNHPLKPWNLEKASAWHEKQPWLIGCNYCPAYAINQLEMWQPETFSLKAIERELQLAAKLGFNSLRVFLHHLPFMADSEGFLKRIEQFLDLAEAHGIGIMPVFFDCVWHPFPRLGPQRDPEPGLHNSGWVQCPGIEVLQDPARFFALEEYVGTIVSRFANDPRVQCWDLWNEPGNSNGFSYSDRDIDVGKTMLVLPYLALAFQWARQQKPSQPITTGVWRDDPWEDSVTLDPLYRLQLEQSDVISFHCYGGPEKLQRLINQLRLWGRPLLCTEYMARGNGSTFESEIPILHKEKVHAYNWGFVAGRTQTIYPWNSWKHPYHNEPDVYHHDIFRADHTPFDQDEVDLIGQYTKKP
ncbi:cellulase family glycosylhydrolase [Rubellicoccus peritrichatus]|uniref:Cellulase family glycosylhydrolase n=1 Tax=Rubellicoccus peritrichatus TaxID=3080537 RepID=A0AAQ3QVL8_9BACT|nr:cellulase family glycosylhydrolase [Puniceicoccus sp. CR14]WOO41040.1 cellulase family glycosylhydrolase [Puniceicoccus sp. CR14]